MQILSYLWPRKYISGARMRAALVVSMSVAGGALAASCPSVGDPQGIMSQSPYQLDLADYQAQSGKTLTLRENPEFAAQVAAGTLPPVTERLPSDALVYLPYDDCGQYGGTLRGMSKALESGTSEILSWRHVNLVRLSDDLQTIVPNVAKSWVWNDDFSSITMTLRTGHKWSDGAPFTADDVVFFIDDIIKNTDLRKTVPSAWMIDDNPVEVTKIDEVTFRFDFAAPYPGLLHYLATGGSYFAPYAPKHHYMKYHASYNANADDEAKAEGHESWSERFGLIYHKWKDAENITPHALTRPTLESHILEAVTNTERRKYIANPYYFKIDSAGNQLPYIFRQHERFLGQELFVLSILNGEVDQKAQGVGLSNFSVLKEGEEAGGYKVTLPPGQTGPSITFNQTIKDLRMREVYADVRFRKAMSLAINRDELNEVLWFGLGTPEAALPLGVAFVTDEDRNYALALDADAANALLDEMGMKMAANGKRLHPDGEPFNILWEYAVQFGGESFTTLVADYWRAVGIDVTLKEVTSQLSREKAKASTSDINMEWDVPFEPNLISQVEYYIPPYSEGSPLVGQQWVNWVTTNGTTGEEPPAWAARLFELGKIWKTVLPGSDEYMKIGAEMVRINLDNMVIIGTVANLPGPTVVSDKLRNITDWGMQNYNYGRTYPFRPDQWYFSE